MRPGAFLLATLLVACSKTSDRPVARRDDRARAERLEAALRPSGLDLEPYSDAERDALDRVRYPISHAVKVCGSERLSVRYDPYIDQLVVGVASDDALTEQLRTIAINGQTLFANKKPFSASPLMFDDSTDTPEKRLAESARVMTGVAAKLGADRDLALDLVATTDLARRVPNDEFGWFARKHAGWHVVVHTFSPANTQLLTAHASKVNAPARTLMVLDRHRNEVSDLRRFAEADITAAVAAYDRGVAEASAAIAAAGPVPFAEHAAAFRIDCPETPLAVDHDKPLR